MLPEFVIEDILRRERNRIEERPQKRLELPVYRPVPEKTTEKSNRGVVIIDL